MKTKKLVVIFLFLSFLPCSLDAMVSGPCSLCHTMHNSQNGAAVAKAITNTGWNDLGELAGPTTATPYEYLLVSSCVGCHSSTTANTIITLGSLTIPIVYNMIEPIKPLAGGNFYWVANPAYGDAYGHNVYGIVGKDSQLTEAPGRLWGCNSTCHTTLAADFPDPMYNKRGCEGCHASTAHHDDSKPWYRFVKAPHGDSYYVEGVEDSDWEYTTDLNDHNYYKGTTVLYWGVGYFPQYKTITAFCTGCHGNFHGSGPLPGQGMGDSSPWIRHPTDIALPQTGEYSAYDPVTNYSTEAPVAWVNPQNPTRAEAVVMCLSCHRAHGSPYKDLLRWDYNQMIANGGGPDTGCFTCHTTKN
jgi:predicted CXXCH cytochrome family protein